MMSFFRGRRSKDVSTNCRSVLLGIVTVLVIFFGFVAGAGFNTIFIMHELDVAYVQRQLLYQADELALTLVKLQVDEETGVRGYIDTHNTAFLEPYVLATHEYDATYNALASATTRLRPRNGGEILSRIDHLHRGWLVGIATSLRGVTSRLHAPSDHRQAFANKRLVDGIRTETSALRTNLVVLDAENNAETQKTIFRIGAVSFGTLVIFSLGFFVVGWRQIRLVSLVERERSLATRLQRAILPTTLPEIVGLDFDGDYRSANSTFPFSGDWYDVVHLVDGRVLISLGDVGSCGFDAAVIMVSVREIIRGVSHLYADPEAILDAANRALQAKRAECTVRVFVGILDVVEGTVTYATAGSPNPLLRTSDGITTFIALSPESHPLGLAKREMSRSLVVRVDPGSTFVFTTTGLTGINSVEDANSERFRALVSDLNPNMVRPATALLAAMGAELPMSDGAVLIVHIKTLEEMPDDKGFMPITRWAFDANDADSATSARWAMVALLDSHGFSPSDLFNAEMVYGELVSNVVRYANGLTEVVLDFSSRSPRLHVLDYGHGFHMNPRLPSDLFSERGRGLWLIKSLSEDFSVTKRPWGGSHARVTLGRGLGDVARFDFAA